MSALICPRGGERASAAFTQHGGWRRGKLRRVSTEPEWAFLRNFKKKWNSELRKTPIKVQNSDPEQAFSVLNVECLYIRMVGEFKFKGNAGVHQKHGVERSCTPEVESVTPNPNGPLILSFPSSHPVECDDGLLVHPADVEGVAGLPFQDGIFQLGVLPEVGVGGGDAADLGSGNGQLGNGEGPHAWEGGRGGDLVISRTAALHLWAQRLILASDLLPSCPPPHRHHPPSAVIYNIPAR